MPQRVAGAEFARLSSLYRFGVLDTAPDPVFDRILRDLAARLDVPVARLVFADAQRFWTKSSVGPGESVFLRERGFVEGLITGGSALVAAQDPGIEMPPGCPLMLSVAGQKVVSMEDDALGALYVGDTRSRDLAAEAIEPFAAALAEIRGLLDSGRRAREDEATGALKHVAFLDQVQRLIDVSRKGRHWISLVVLDVAPFRAALEAKAVGLGSFVVHHMAELRRAQVRRRDSFGRLSENTFAVLLTDTGEVGARVLAQRLCRHLERGWTAAGLVMNGPEFGLASIKPSGAGDTAHALLERASATRWTSADQQPTVRVA